MLNLAVTSSLLSRIENYQGGLWFRIGIAVLVLIAVVVVLRKVAKMNKVILAVVVLLIVSFVGFNWLYEGNEPDWARPIIQPISKFFPTKDSMK